MLQERKRVFRRETLVFAAGPRTTELSDAFSSVADRYERFEVFPPGRIRSRQKHNGLSTAELLPPAIVRNGFMFYEALTYNNETNADAVCSGLRGSNFVALNNLDFNFSASKTTSTPARNIRQVLCAGFNVLLVILDGVRFDYALAPTANPFLVMLEIVNTLSALPQLRAVNRLLPGQPMHNGRPRLIDQDELWYSFLLEFLALSGVRADPRVRNGQLFPGGEFSVPSAWKYITKKVGEFQRQHADLPPPKVPALKSLYRYFSPLRPNSRQGRTHHSVDGGYILWMRPKPSPRDGKDIYLPNSHWCNSLLLSALNLWSPLGPSRALVISSDNMATANSVGQIVAHPRKVWTSVDPDHPTGASAPSHSYGDIARLGITPTCTLQLLKDTPSNATGTRAFTLRGGKLGCILKSAFHHKSTCIAHLDERLHQFATGFYTLAPTGLPPHFLKVSDNGADQGLSRPNRFVHTYEFLLCGYDISQLITTAPSGGSKYDPVEHGIGVLQSQLGGSPLVDSKTLQDLMLDPERPQSSRLTEQSADTVVRLGLEALKTRLLRSGTGETPTFSGIPITVEIWDDKFDSRVRYLSPELAEVVKALKHTGARASQVQRQRIIPTTSQTVSALKSVGVNAPAGILVGSVLDLLESSDHTHADDNFWTVFRCGKSGCALCPGRLRDTSLETESLLGKAQERGFTAALLLQPLLDPDRPGHYLQLQDKITRLVNTPPDRATNNVHGLSERVRSVSCRLIERVSELGGAVP
jgi:hypothetical protein